MAALNTSSEVIYQLISRKVKGVPEEGLPLSVDVRDVAQAHILALKNNLVISKQVLLSGGPFTFYEANCPLSNTSRNVINNSYRWSNLLLKSVQSLNHVSLLSMASN
jgi:hypothetical protein